MHKSRSQPCIVTDIVLILRANMYDKQDVLLIMQ